MRTEDDAGQRIVLRRYPQGALRPTDFAIEPQAALVLAEDEFLVRNRFISVDPMLRLYIDRNPPGSGSVPLPLGSTIPGAAVGQVIASRHPDYAAGEHVEGRFGWQHFAVSKAAGVHRVSHALGPVENALGVGGLPGFTAYVGLRAAGGVKPGETFLVSGAAGAVGSVAGALIRARGGRAVGIAAGTAKCRYLVEAAGYDAAADRTSPDFLEQLHSALPAGADVYFDNVGGPLLSLVMPLIVREGLVLICGLMAQYQVQEETGPDRLPGVLRAVMGGMRIQGFTQYGQDALRPAFEAEMAELLAAGKIKPALHIEEGIERLPHALCGLFDHSVAGKVVVRVAEKRTA